MDENTKLQIFTFPSGRTFVVHPLTRSNGDGKPKPLRKAKGPCEYLGKAIKAKVGCGGAARGGVWECTHPRLTGKCAPIDILPIAEPGCITCELCDYHKDAKGPRLDQLLMNFASAVARWVKARRPVRSQERVNELLKICSSCPLVARNNDGSMWCTGCGCPVNNMTDDPIRHRNKLVMGTETCPHDPPLWSDSPPAPAPPQE